MKRSSKIIPKALIYYGAEYRHIPGFMSATTIKLLGKDLQIDWIQLVLFGELGWEAPQREVDLLHENMKWDTGIGIRTFVNNILIRVNWAYSEEGSQVRMNVNHPF